MINLINLGYLVAAVFFILGIKGLTTPKTAVRGNKLSAIGMLLAVVIALFDYNVVTYEFIILGIVIGTIIGVITAKKIAMTEMPELVATLNGVGGGASLFVAAANYLEDRKSTRLNSSHVRISYAVFCLKK